MPNWVYNYVSISGETKQVQAFVKLAKTPYTTHDKGKIIDGKYDPNFTSSEERKAPLMFWNFIRPKPSELAAYHGLDVVDKIDLTSDKEQTLKNRGTTNGGNWYEWNTSNWGTKWDACDVEMEELTTDTATKRSSVSYRFSTAWSIPEPVFVAMVEKFPDLDFTFWCEEEQGWGASYSGVAGSLSLDKAWDIPNSHADYVANDNEDSCPCNRYEDEEEWYSDCPKDKLDK